MKMIVVYKVYGKKKEVFDSSELPVVFKDCKRHDIW